MQHKGYPEVIEVGCICAGVMEGDILAAKDRERMLKNRANRRKSFIHKTWIETEKGALKLIYKHSLYVIYRAGSGYYYGSVNGTQMKGAKGPFFPNIHILKNVMFDYVDQLGKDN